MAHCRNGTQRSSGPLILLLLALILPVFPSCTPGSSRITGWTIDGQSAVDTAEIPVSATQMELVTDLPAGYKAADGFTQTVELLAEGMQENSTKQDIGVPLILQIPESDLITVKVLIGFCPSDDDSVCHIASSSIALHRSPLVPSSATIQLSFAPEVPD